MSHQYITLLAALPDLGVSYHIEQPPISRYQLEKRLTLLDDGHRQLLVDIEKVLHWDHLNDHFDDREIIQSGNKLLTHLVDQQLHTLEQIIRWRLDLRTILAALRYRRLDYKPESLNPEWGAGGLVQHIEDHWHHPTFNLEARFTWLPEMHAEFRDDNSMGVERVILDANWQALRRGNANHYFDFTAVVCYVLQWNLIARWCSYDADKAVLRFHKLVDYALGDFAKLSFNQ